MIAEGHHKARAIASDIGVSQQKMTPFVKVTFATDGGEEVDWYGYVSDSPKAQEILVDSLRAMGFVGGADDLDQLAGLDQEQVGAFLPAQVSLKVEHEEFKGRTQARVRYVNPVKTVAPGGGSIFSSLKAAFAAKPAVGAPPPPPPKPGPKARPEPQQVSDDDIPFLPPHHPLSRPGGPGKPGPRARGVMKPNASNPVPPHMEFPKMVECHNKCGQPIWLHHNYSEAPPSRCAGSARKSARRSSPPGAGEVTGILLALALRGLDDALETAAIASARVELAGRHLSRQAGGAATWACVLRGSR